MNSLCNREQYKPIKFGEPVFVVMTYLLAQFSVLAIAGNLPVHHPLLVGSLLSTFFSGIVVLAASLWLDRSNGGAFFGTLQISVRQVSGYIFAAIGLCLGIYVLVQAVPYEGPKNPMLATAFLDKGPPIRVTWVVSLLLAAPICEEIVFRGAIQAYVKRRLGVVVAISLSALAFAAVHLPQISSYWPAATGIFGLGLLAGYAKERSGSLLASIATHATYNATTLAFVLAGHS